MQVSINSVRVVATVEPTAARCEEVAVLGFRPSYDCTKKICPFGYAWGDMPEANSTNSKKLTTDRAHQQEGEKLRGAKR